jgi:TolB-like protein/DNA-binding winged helix-turn-helix (wHTH) protein/Tfp pilus assembly protein PilF
VIPAKSRDRGNIYSFNDVIVDGDNFRVERAGQVVTLTPKAFDVLVFLLENAGRVIEKQEIFDHAWKGAFVGDNALTKVIKEIRHALEDPAGDPHYIETVPKRGYRFIGDVLVRISLSPEMESSTERSAVRSKIRALLFLAIGFAALASLTVWIVLRQGSKAPAPRPVRSIAVLPFRPLNMADRDESLEMGMAETLIARLSNIKQIVVRPFSSVRKYSDIEQDAVKAGRELQAEAVLEGSIQKSGERVRITVRLINVETGNPLWTEQFDERFTDIFKVQDSIAERITTALALELSRQEREQIARHYTDSADAYELYLQGQMLWHRRRPEWIEQSLATFQQALAKDPDFALAHIGIAECYIMLSGHRRISMQEAETKARPEILRALELDNDLAMGHNALAELKYQYEYDWTGAEQEFKKAIELNPNVAWIRQANGWFLMSMGRFDEAAGEMDMARQFDPNSLTINVGRGRLYYYSRQYDQAMRHYENIVAVEPNDFSSINSLSAIYERKGMYPEAFEAFMKTHYLEPEKAAEFREAFETGGWEGFARKQLAETERIAETKSKPMPSTFVDIYLRLGDKEKAFFWLEKVFEERDPAILQFKIEPAYDPLRTDPRYAKLLEKVGLKP